MENFKTKVLKQNIKHLKPQNTRKNQQLQERKIPLRQQQGCHSLSQKIFPE